MSPSNLKSSVVWIAEFLPSASLCFLIAFERRSLSTRLAQETAS
ncbi:hypothetical protein SynBIOSE41_02587 [Synechococcus sp. BIOS-E4-1]|nr:hypothetical protein SynBIOSE41_02587 [Synechococcus sp. BIOS-E4-1]